MKKTKHFILFIFLLFVARVYSQSYTVYPIPQKMTMGNQTVELSPVFNVIIEDGIHITTINRLREVVENAGFTMSGSMKREQLQSVQTNNLAWSELFGKGCRIGLHLFLVRYLLTEVINLILIYWRSIRTILLEISLFWAMIKNLPIMVWRH